MILGRKKRKEKKAKKLQEEAARLAFIQAAATASIQLEGNDHVAPRRIPSSLSISTEKIYEEEEEAEDQEENSEESADEREIDALSLTLSEPPGQHYGARGFVYYHGENPPQLSSPLAQQQFPMPNTSMQPFLYRSSSSKALSIPTTVAEIPSEGTVGSSIAAATNGTSVHHQPIMVRTESSGTLQKKKKAAKELPKISPEKAELIAGAVSLGLGRGVDVTDKMPWLNKRSFQIRRVHTNILETNEGGILMNYNHEVQSVAEVEEQFVSSLNPPETAVSIHIEDELDRNVSSTRRIVGRRIINRSIGFQADFEEKYKDGETMKLTKDSFCLPKDPAEVICNTQSSGHTFEERVCQWLVHRLVHKSNITIHKINDNPIDQLLTVMNFIPKIEDELKASCEELIQSLKVTHYVNKILLGATEYRVMSDGQYHKKIALEGAFGVDSLAVEVSKTQTKMSKKEATKCSQLRQIGRIEDGHVAKGTQDEVVLEVQVQPISRLIKLPALKAAFKMVLEKYMERTPTSEGGPFVVKCTGRDLYLTVNKFNNYEVEATNIPTEASLFYFQTTDEGGNPFEFHIAYYGEDTDPNDEISDEDSAICRYLEAPLNPKGRCPGPLLMKHSVKIKNTRFTLRSRLSKKNNKSHLGEWIAGEDAFYIACATKKYQHGSYLAVKAVNNTDFIGKHLYMTCCDPSIHNHNGENTFMLFQVTTKEAILKKKSGAETPGKLPMMNGLDVKPKHDHAVVAAGSAKKVQDSSRSPQHKKT